MNIILIDDDCSTVEMLQTTIHWDNLEIKEIYTAYNNNQAKALFLEHPIDIMLCDIEMPNGSGIELLEWLRNNSYIIQAIFLTNHAEFHFAQQAIKLDSTDFITKMSSIQTIEASIRHAVNIVKTIEITNRYLVYGHCWEKNKELLFRQFWHDVYLGKVVSTKVKMQLEAKKRNIDLDTDLSAVLVLITASRLQDSLQDWGLSEFDFCIANVASEVFFNVANSPYLIDLERTKKAVFMAILHPESAYNQVEDIQKKCMELVDLYQQFLHCSVNFYISEPCSYEQFSTTIHRLENLDKNNVTQDQSITLETDVRKAIQPQAETISINYDELYSFLSTGQSFPLIVKVKEYFALVPNKKIDSQFLYGFSQHYNQLLYAAIRDRKLEVTQLFGGDREQLLCNHAIDSVYDMLKWITVSATLMSDELKKQNQSLSTIGIVKKYIYKNYQNRITKTEIANTVFLSPDYLAKIFKKDTGILLSDYINQVRVEKSKALLNDPSIPLSNVAEQVGFEYYSYYSTVFKKQEGITPKEYRSGIQKSLISK